MLKNICKITILLILYLIICHIIYNYEKKDIETTLIGKHEFQGIIPKKQLKKEKIESPIGKLIIKKIHINNELYSKDSSKNNIEKNITILKNSIAPNQENSIMFLAAHSGHGKIAYFRNIHKLEKNDEIILEYKNKNYYYQVKDIWQTEKNGTINVQKEIKNQLVLTTCSSNKNQQLIINCIQK